MHAAIRKKRVAAVKFATITIAVETGQALKVAGNNSRIHVSQR